MGRINVPGSEIDQDKQERVSDEECKGDFVKDGFPHLADIIGFEIYTDGAHIFPLTVLNRSIG